MRVRHDSRSAALVRHQISQDLGQAGIDEATIDAVTLVASELVGNAVRHTAPGWSRVLEVSWERDDAGVVVRVHDASAALPTRRIPTPDEPSGRGLRIIDAVADHWGVIPDRAGKNVWAHIATIGPAAFA